MKLDSMDATFYGAVAVLVTVVLVLFGSGVFRGDGASVTSWNTFVFGEGPWVVWHVFLLASLLAFGVALIIVNVTSGDEGAVAFLVLIASLSVLMVMTLVDGVLWSTTLFDSWAARYLGGPMLVVAPWLASLVLLLVYNLVLSYFVSGGWAGPLAVAALPTGIVVLNLYALHAYHDAGAS